MVGHSNPARSSGRVAPAGIVAVQLTAASAVLARVCRWTCWPPYVATSVQRAPMSGSLGRWSVSWARLRPVPSCRPRRPAHRPGPPNPPGCRSAPSHGRHRCRRRRRGSAPAPRRSRSPWSRQRSLARPGRPWSSRHPAAWSCPGSLVVVAWAVRPAAGAAANPRVVGEGIITGLLRALGCRVVPVIVAAHCCDGRAACAAWGEACSPWHEWWSLFCCQLLAWTVCLRRRSA
jgi:hypothetical protein